MRISAKSYCRGIAWLGVALVLGPGSSIPNDFDSLFQIGGLLLTIVGTIAMLLCGRMNRLPDEDS